MVEKESFATAPAVEEDRRDVEPRPPAIHQGHLQVPSRGPAHRRLQGWRPDLLWYVLSDFRITPVKSGFTLQIYPRVYVNMFRFNPRATLGVIFFTVLIQKSEKQWKVLSGCLKNLPLGIPSRIP